MPGNPGLPGKEGERGEKVSLFFHGLVPFPWGILSNLGQKQPELAHDFIGS